MQTLRDAFSKKKIVPYKDILQDRISENSFAVGFHAVLNGTADEIYNNPKLFFDLTHVTKNLAGIYRDVLSRMAYGGSRPLQVIDTTFGGGKTHTLVALYHLFTSPDIAKNNPDLNRILSTMDLTVVPEISLVAIDCHNISSVKRKDRARTIWGEIGLQLGQYELVRIYDQEMRRPDADTLSKLITSTDKPVLIMLDELVNYLKDAKAEPVGEQNLAEVTVSFIHTFTDVIVNSKNGMLILTLPGTESAYNEETELLEQYKTKIREISGREASFTVPMERSEIYDVIRKRLFRTVDHQYAIEVAENLLKYYAGHEELFPVHVLSNDYRTKISKSYPFHPALVDLLYERIGTIAEFQKTRGVLRLLSYVLKNIYQNIDRIELDSIITPGIVDLNDINIFQELTNKIAKGEFQSVINSDIVNDESTAKCQRFDNKSMYGSNVRISTTIYLYSLIGSKNEASKGISQNELVLATSVEGITYPKDVLNDALNLENSLWYIYNKAGKLYFSVEVNINKVIVDETQNIDQILYDPEIKKRLRNMLTSDIFDVHVWEEDVRNPRKPTLVVPNFHSVVGTEMTIPASVKTIIEKEGTSFRSKKNLMYVLGARDDRTARMVEASRRFLAIKELKGAKKNREDISANSEKIELFLKEADSTLNGTIERCYSLIYYPKGTEIKSITVADGYEGAKNLPDKVYKALIKGGKIIESINPEYIVDRVFGDRTEMTVQELIATFDEAPIHFLPKNKDIIYDAVKRGLQDKQFALYIGGIGDIIAIDRENFISVSEKFYFGRAFDSDVGDGHYLLPKFRATIIEQQLNSHAELDHQNKLEIKVEGDSGNKELNNGINKITIAPIPVNEKSVIDPDDISQYPTWIIRSIEIKFENIRLFQQIQSNLSIMLLGQSNIIFNINIHSKTLDVNIAEAENKDINSMMEPLFKLSSMFNKELVVSIFMNFTKDTKLDQDLIESIQELSAIKSELTFKAYLEK